MKKIYFAPNIKIVKIETNRLMQASAGILDKSQTISNSDGFGSRSGGSLWDNDEEY